MIFRRAGLYIGFLFVSILLFAPFFVSPVTVGTISFTPELSIAHAQTGAETTGPVAETPTDQNADISVADVCSGFSFLSIECIVSALSWLVFLPVSLILSLSAGLFDIIMGYSISSAAYSGSFEFIVKGWAIIRDFTNILFVFALMFIAFSTVTGIGNANYKKMLPKLILIALVINFSLFLGRVVIDASNILARVFYQNIDVASTQSPDGRQDKRITEAIMEKLKPQRFLSQEIYESNSFQRQGFIGKLTTGLTVNMVLTAVNIVLIYVFLSVALLFAGRVVALWVSLIISPLAFASAAVPGKVFDVISFPSWFSSLVKNAFSAPVFLFFLYLIALFFNLDLFSPPTNVGTIEYLVIVLVPILIVIVLLLKGLEMTKKLSEGVATTVSSYAGKALGFATTAALSGGAALGRYALGGRFATGLNRGSEWLKNNTGAVGQYAGRQIGNIAEALPRQTFDLRRIQALQRLGKESGIDINQKTGIGAIDQTLGMREGGYEAASNRTAQRREGEGNRRVRRDTSIYTRERETLSNLAFTLSNDPALRARHDAVAAAERRVAEQIEEISTLRKEGASPAEIAAARAELITRRGDLNTERANRAAETIQPVVIDGVSHNTYGSAMTAINTRQNELRTTIQRTTNETLRTFSEEIRRFGDTSVGAVAGMVAGATVATAALTPVAIPATIITALVGGLSGRAAGKGVQSAINYGGGQTLGTSPTSQASMSRIRSMSA